MLEPVLETTNISRTLIVTLASDMLENICKSDPKAVATIVELTKECKNQRTRKLAVNILKRMGQDNSIKNLALVELMNNNQDDSIQDIVASQLKKIGQGNETAIVALIELIGNSESDDTRRRAADILGKIDPGNDTAIAALVELIGNSESDDTRRQAAESLGKIDPGNDTAIATLVELIDNTQSEDTCRDAVFSLGKIGRGNDTAITALVELIDNTQSELITELAIWNLWKIDPDNNTAIAPLVELIDSEESKSLLPVAITILNKILQDNEKEIAALVKLIGNTHSENIRRQAIDSLGQMIVAEPQMPQVVSALKDYLSDETYKNDRDLFNRCYRIIWNYAQTLPYPDFHQAWHDLPTSPPATQTLEQQLTNIRTQHQHLPLLCIDAEILETETTETAIAQTLCELIYTTALPEADYPEVNNAPQLRKHLRPIAQQQGRSRLVILMHNSEPQPEIQQFCRKIANIAHIAWITETPLEPPLRGFAPSQEDLAGAIASWLQELGINK